MKYNNSLQTKLHVSNILNVYQFLTALDSINTHQIDIYEAQLTAHIHQTLNIPSYTPSIVSKSSVSLSTDTPHSIYPVVGQKDKINNINNNIVVALTVVHVLT